MREGLEADHAGVEPVLRNHRSHDVSGRERASQAACPHVLTTSRRPSASTANCLAGSLPAKQYKLVAAWLMLHEDELYKAWNAAVSGHPFDRIKPLS